MLTSGVAAQLYTLNAHLKTPRDIAASLKRVKAIGYQAVQLSGLGPIEPAELAAILKGEGLQAIITHVSFDRLLHDLPALLAEHALWECPHIAIGGLPGEYRSEAGYAEFGKIASRVADTLAAEGYTFSYHNHSFELEKFHGKSGLEILYANASPRVLGELDTYWVQHGGANPVTWIRALRNRMVVIHLKDMGVADGQQVMAEVGEGNLEWPAILAACRESGVQWFAVEQDVCRRDPFESLAISLRNLRALGVDDVEASAVGSK